LSQNGQNGSLLVCNWPHSVGQNHFIVMMLLNRDSVIFRVFLFRVLLEDSAQFPSQRNRIPCIRSDNVISFQTLNSPSIIYPDDENFQCGPSSMSRSFKLFQVASVRTFQQYVQTPFSVRLAVRFLSKTQIWEDSCNHLDDVCSRPDTLIHKASRAFKVQPFGRQSSWSGRSSFIYGNCVHQINRPDDICYGSDAPSLDMETACN
jgi:hypothetical protein